MRRLIFFGYLLLIYSCSQPAIEVWTTTSDQKMLLKKSISNQPTNDHSSIEVHVDPSQQFQSIEGFGFTLTGGSAELIMQLNESKRDSLLTELFTLKEDGIGISYLRLSLGASDLSSRVFSYNDLPLGQTDTSIEHFSLADDTMHLIPLLREILKKAPGIRIMASPWSPPVWMKDNGSSIGGKLLKRYYSSYARYFVKYITAMKKEGIIIDAITIQNEPQHPGNNPSLLMSALEQAEFVGVYLGPAFHDAQLTTKIIIWDHNCDRPDFPLTVLADSVARLYVHGSAFHLYAGDVRALSDVHNAYPQKQLYFTEQWTGSNGTFSGDLQWHMKNVMIGSLRNWSTTVLEWNLANDPEFNPHTPGGCTECKGALTINGNIIGRNVSYYIVGHASRFIPAGSIRIASSSNSVVHHVAFIRPDNRWTVLLLNESDEKKAITIVIEKKRHPLQLMPKSVVSVLGPLTFAAPKQRQSS